MAKTVRTADLTGYTAANLFVALNGGDVEFMSEHPFNFASLPMVGVLVTDKDPDELTYPEGWYFAKGTFRNKHNTSSGRYDEIPILQHDGTPW